MLGINVLYQLYATAYKVRFVETLIAENYHLGLMRCPTHLSIGQELVPAILDSFHDPKHLAVSTHRSHGHYIGKRGSLRKFFDELHGMEEGCSSGNGGSMHLIDKSVGFIGSTAIVANTIPVGVGLANAQKLNRENSLTYIFIGDGATEEGVFYESLHYCAINNLPALFVIENNEFSVYTDLKTRQKGTSIKSKVEGFNVNYFLCNDHDFNYLYEIWGKSISSIKHGSRPYVIEIMTHRLREHCGPNFDDQLLYRNVDFLKKWEEKDLIKMLKENIFKIEKDLNKLNSIEEKIESNVKSIFNDSLSQRKFFQKKF